MPAFTMAISRPFFWAWYKKAECMASRTGLLPLKLKLTLLKPPLVRQPGQVFLTSWTASKKSTA